MWQYSSDQVNWYLVVLFYVNFSKSSFANHLGTGKLNLHPPTHKKLGFEICCWTTFLCSSGALPHSEQKKKFFWRVRYAALWWKLLSRPSTANLQTSFGWQNFTENVYQRVRLVPAGNSVDYWQSWLELRTSAVMPSPAVVLWKLNACDEVCSNCRTLDREKERREKQLETEQTTRKSVWKLRVQFPEPDDEQFFFVKNHSIFQASWTSKLRFIYDLDAWRESEVLK